MDIVNQFGINPLLLLAQIINFAILLFFLKLFLYKPILKILDERKAKVAKALKDAEEIEKHLALTEEEQEKILAKARTEASKMINQAKLESKELAEKMLSETKVTIDEMLQRSEERTKLEKEQMLKEVKKDLADLVIAASSKVTNKTMDSDANRTLVKETVEEITK